MLRCLMMSLVVVFTIFNIAYSETGASVTNSAGWDAGYVTGVEIYKNETTGKFIRLTTSAVVCFASGFYNSEQWKGTYIQGAVYIPWSTTDDLYSAMLFSTLQRAINDKSRNIKFYSVRYNSNDVTTGNGTTTNEGCCVVVLKDFRLF